jgi:hypothetical protein
MYAGPSGEALREPTLPEMGFANRLDELEWDFIQARAENLDLDSLGWTDREFSSSTRYWDTSVKASRRALPLGLGFPPPELREYTDRRTSQGCCSEGVKTLSHREISYFKACLARTERVSSAIPFNLGACHALRAGRIPAFRGA